MGPIPKVNKSNIQLIHIKFTNLFEATQFTRTLITAQTNNTNMHLLQLCPHLMLILMPPHILRLQPHTQSSLDHHCQPPIPNLYDLDSDTLITTTRQISCFL